MTAAALLALALLVPVPLWGLWRSRAGRPQQERKARYRSTIALGLGLLVALALVAWREGLGLADLGLDPLDRTGAWALAAAAALLGLLALGLRSSKARERPDERATAMFPQSADEVPLFAATILVAGIGWELLYRGFLLWFLPPLTGLWPAVALAGLAYGLAHGWHSGRRFAASLVSAMLFATGYALTHSLWWLILIHLGLPLLGYLGWRRLRPAPPATPAEALA
ncbi:CPBP family intramembrane glutamic endopeptidase [Sphingomonas astaxanthinifaciens]|uniref:CAAX prenyl protease 2/Lysostaphin resistance protein A-like domain-containing protein n=1 Tax=Sphingomonas astaxanthinifaciens DSM 22298 TaxID=1123267 RepID=A0ABQ5Z6S7_9SPHN|nr:CPBP family intramembrane glutamic endopeptidase [Sphingomonas astaxanthinifaciens]GLR46479.1 hypothetical protein GCM10007925_01900 [Sphingomonas astaxanthinifaciens DSM 22298]